MLDNEDDDDDDDDDALLAVTLEAEEVDASG